VESDKPDVIHPGTNCMQGPPRTSGPAGNGGACFVSQRPTPFVFPGAHATENGMFRSRKRRQRRDWCRLRQFVTVCRVSGFDGNVADYFATQHGLITIGQILDAGGSTRIASRRCNDGSWERIRRGVFRLAGAPRTERQDVLAAVLTAPPGSVAWGPTAAAIHQLPGFNVRPVTVTVRDDQRPRNPAAALRRTSKLLPHHVTTVDSIPITTVARTLFDLAASEHPRRVERALDTALSTNAVTVVQCLTVLHDLQQSGRNGVRLFRQLLDDRGEGSPVSESELELQFEYLLKAHGLPVPDRQVNVGTDTQWLGRIDYRLNNGQLVEIDSRRHHTALVDYERDLDINNQLLATGNAPPLRVTYKMMRDQPERVAALIRKAARSRTDAAFPGAKHTENG
jgi:hypothetical protein